MGFFLSKLWWSLGSVEDRPYKILVLGLNGAGKTSVLYSLLFGQLVPTQPTLGSNVEEFSYKNVKFVAWDLGGQELLRMSWPLFFTETDAVILVVDAADPERFDTVKAEIAKFIHHPDLAKACVLVFANKQDLQGGGSASAGAATAAAATSSSGADGANATGQQQQVALPPAEVARRLDLAQLLGARSWTIQGCSAVAQTGLHDGLAWVVERLKPGAS